MNEVVADKLSMLLSTNWFFDHWPMIGLVVNGSQHMSIQLACRNIVKEMMSDATVYWNVSFSAERRAKTESDLIACFVASGADRPVIEHLRATLGNGSIGSYDSGSSSMLAAMTDQLLKASKSGEVFEMDVRFKERDPSVMV